MTLIIIWSVTGGGGYKVIQRGDYTVRQVGGYNVSFTLDFRMWGFIRSNCYFFVAVMRAYKVTHFFDLLIRQKVIFRKYVAIRSIDII